MMNFRNICSNNHDQKIRFCACTKIRKSIFVPAGRLDDHAGRLDDHA